MTVGPYAAKNHAEHPLESAELIENHQSNIERREGVLAAGMN
jgi:hypothetical protein